MSGPHDKIIADAAKQALKPLGFRRKGRSRLWLADHDWWLEVIEFQPSGLSKGSFLNVAAHWLWSESGHLSFDLGGRTAGFEVYVSDEQFALAAHQLAVAAAQEVRKLTLAFTSIGATADLLSAREASLPPQSRGSWSTFHAGVAAGLAGRASEASALFSSVTDERVEAAAQRLAKLLPEPQRFQRELASLVAKQRNALGLPELDASPF